VYLGALTSGRGRSIGSTLTLTGLSIDQSAEPVIVRVGLIGDEVPPDSDTLAGLLAADYGRAVDVAHVPTESGSAPAP